MKTTFYPNETRGSANHGWLRVKFSFSFANFYDVNREQFGKLRVLNDDIIAPSKGFGTHPHSNMEIISIPLSGALAHKDSLGHEGVINTGDVQVMSAGSGIEHSEYNASDIDHTNLLQIWLFPNKANIKPRYDQKTFDSSLEENKFLTVVSPKNVVEGALWIHQDAYFNLATIDKDKTINYSLRNKNNLVYIFVIKGAITIEEISLKSKDALGIEDIGEIDIQTLEKARVLLIETPK